MRRIWAYLLFVPTALGCAAPRSLTPGATPDAGTYEVLRGIVRLHPDSAAARAATAMPAPRARGPATPGLGRWFASLRGGSSVREAVVYLAEVPAGYVPGPPPLARSPWSAFPPASSWRAAEEAARRQAAERAAAPRTTVISERGNAYVPRVAVAREGDTLVIANRDLVYHSPFSVSPASTFELGLLAPRSSQRLVLERPGVVQLFCQLHASCVGYVFVAPTPVYARPRSNGAWALPALPPGDYVIRAWHPDFGERTHDVTLPRGRRRLTIRF